MCFSIVKSDDEFTLEIGIYLNNRLLYITLDLFYVCLEKQNLYNEIIDSDAIQVQYLPQSL